MDTTFSTITNFFGDGIFGHVIRFIFDRFLGGFFTNNINFSNIVDLKNCQFKDLNLDPDKINRKFFNNSVFRLFSGKIGCFGIKFPAFNQLLTESIEVQIEKIDIILTINEVDFSKAEEEISEMDSSGGKNSKLSKSSASKKNNSMTGNLHGKDKNFDIYKKIINQILMNMKLKVKDICVRIVSEKPYKDVRLPIAPCLMLKIKKIGIKKRIEEQQATNPEANQDANHFTKNQNYDLGISGITLHMLSNYEVKQDEYVTKDEHQNKEELEFPFDYPDESHPSTFLVCASKQGKKAQIGGLPNAQNQNHKNKIQIFLSLSNEKQKSVEVTIPNIEIMVDFLKIKYISIYVDKLMELQRYNDFKAGLIKRKEDMKNKAQRRLSFDRKGSSSEDGSDDQEGGNIEQDTDNKLNIAGYEIDIDYFKNSMHKKPPTNMNPEEEKQAPEKMQQSLSSISRAESDFKMEGINEFVSETLEMSPEKLFDPSNMNINVTIRSIYTYILKLCPAFLDAEFKRCWIFGQNSTIDTLRSFNKKIPVNYFQIKATNLNLSARTKDKSVDFTLSSFKILDIIRADTPLKGQNDVYQTTNLHQQPLHNNQSFNFGANAHKTFNQSTFNASHMWKGAPISQGSIGGGDIFQSFVNMDKSQSIANMGTIVGLRRNTSSDPNESSMLFQSAKSDINKEFLSIRELRKPIIEFDIDSKREHFCVNVIFKFNKKHQSGQQKGDKKSNFKPSHYLEDSIVHSPLNNGPVRENMEIQAKYFVARFQMKNGKVLGSVELPSIYMNFYPSLIRDMNSLLHNASDSYKFCEVWYQEQNAALISKWEEELMKGSNIKRTPSSMKSPSSTEERSEKKRVKIAYTAEQINSVLVDFYKTQEMAIELSLGIPLIKIATNIEKNNLYQQANNTTTTFGRDQYCYCGLQQELCQIQSKQYAPTKSFFKRDFVICEITEIGIKFQNNPINYSNIVLPNDKAKTKIQKSFAHILFKDFAAYLPVNISGENQVFLNQLLFIGSHDVDDKVVLPCIFFQKFEEISNEANSSPVKLYDKDLNKLKEEQKNQDKDNWQSFSSFNAHQDAMNFKTFTSDIRVHNAHQSYQKHMNKRLGFDKSYIQKMETSATTQVKCTIPSITLHASKDSINFLQRASKDWTTSLTQINEQLKGILEEEAQFYSKIIEKKFPKKKVSNDFFSLYINQIDAQILEDKEYNQKCQQLVEQKKKKVPISNHALSSIRLDASIDEGSINFGQSMYYPPQAQLKFIFPQKEFEECCQEALTLRLSQISLIYQLNFKHDHTTCHFEIYDINVLDKDQLTVHFGNFNQSLSYGSNPELLNNKDLAKHFIMYKHSYCDELEGVQLKSLKEYDYFKETELPYIYQDNYKVFETKNKNAFQFGFFTFSDEKSVRMDVDASISNLITRFDFQFKWLEKLLQTFKQEKNNSQNSGSAQNLKGSVDGNGSQHSKAGHDPSQKKKYIKANVNLENFLIDINPYSDYNYYNKWMRTPGGFTDKKTEEKNIKNLFYSNLRSLLAVNSLSANVSQIGSKVTLDRFELQSIDFLFKKVDNSQIENQQILIRNHKMKEFTLFDQEFKVMRDHFGYISHPLLLNDLQIQITGMNQNIFQFEINKIQLDLYSDTIALLEQHFHLISYLISLNKKEKENRNLEKQQQEKNQSQAQDSKQQQNKNESQVIEEQDEDEDFLAGGGKNSKIGNNSKISGGSNQKGSIESSQNKAYITKSDEEFSIDNDFFAPTEDSEMYKPQKSGGFGGYESDEDLITVEDDSYSQPNKEFVQSVESQLTEATTFLSTGNAYMFDEDNIHSCSLNDQQQEKKSNFKVGEINIKLYKDYEFGHQNDIIEVALLDELNGEDKKEEQHTEIKTHEFQKPVSQEEQKDQQASECICLLIENFSSCLMLYKQAQYTSTKAIWRVSSFVENFEVIDLIVKNKKKQGTKIISKIAKQYSNLEQIKKQSISKIKSYNAKLRSGFNNKHAFNAVVECYKHSNSEKKDLRIFTGIHPIKVAIAKQHHLFLKSFIDKLSLRRNTNFVAQQQQQQQQPEEEQKEEVKSNNNEQDQTGFFIPVFYIAPIEVKINANFDISFINFDVFKDLTLTFKSQIIRGIEQNQLKDLLLQYYIKHVKRQIGKAVKDLPLLRNIKNLSSATFNIFYSPYTQYRDGGSVLGGLRSGLSGFFFSVTGESFNLISFFASTIGNVFSSGN